MKPTKSQFDQMRPLVLQQAVMTVVSLSNQLGSAVAQVEGAQRMVDATLQGRLGDTTRELVLRKTATLHQELDNLARIRSGLASAADQMMTATSNVRSAVQSAEASGYGVNDDWSIAPQQAGRATMRTVSGAKELQARITDAVNAWDEADKSAGDQAQKAIDDAAAKEKEQQKEAEKEAEKEKEAGGSGSFGLGGNVLDVARALLGRNASDLEQAGIGMNPGVDPTECCANFVSATLRRAGLIDWHTDRVDALASRLQAQGWHVTSNPPPGAVAIINGDAHTELVASNNGGRVTLIGSNNINADGTQRVSYSNPYGNIMYLVPPG